VCLQEPLHGYGLLSAFLATASRLVPIKAFPKTFIVAETGERYISFHRLHTSVSSQR
jgi:hypothetical protein